MRTTEPRLRSQVESSGEYTQDALAPEGLPPDVIAQVPTRLLYAALGAAGIFTLALLTEPFRPADATGSNGSYLIAGAGMAFSFVVAIVVAIRRPTPAIASRLAMALQVGTGILIWALEFAVPFADAGHTPGVPTVAGWMLFFPVLVPLRVRDAIAGNIALVLAGPGIIAAYVAAGQPMPSIGHLTLWFLAAAFAGIAGSVTAAVLQNALIGLHEARERDRYVLVRRLGRGGMGDVFVARHQRLARLAAVKRIRVDALDARLPGGAEAVRQRFTLEARTTARLRSPHTVELYDYGISEDGSLFYAMELLDGMDLQALVEAHGPQPPARVVHILLQACDALAEAHQEGLVHRDIKPSNLMICRLGVQRDVTKVLDFGTVKLPQGAPENAITRADVFIGTPSYAAPEAGYGAVEPRTDLYALGCVGWFLLTGGTVFPAADISDALRAHREDPVPPLDHVTPLDVPAGLEAVLRECLEKRPVDRIASASLLAEKLRELKLEWSQSDAEAWWANAGPSAKPAERQEGWRSAEDTWAGV